MLKVGRSTAWRKVVVPVGRQGMDVTEAVGKYVRFGRRCGEWRRENRSKTRLVCRRWDLLLCLWSGGMNFHKHYSRTNTTVNSPWLFKKIPPDCRWHLVYKANLSLPQQPPWEGRRSAHHVLLQQTSWIKSPWFATWTFLVHPRQGEQPFFTAQDKCSLLSPWK